MNFDYQILLKSPLTLLAGSAPAPVFSPYPEEYCVHTWYQEFSLK